MTLQELATALRLEFKGEADYAIEGVQDIETLSPEQGLQEHRVYFIESPAVLKRHPKAVEGGVVLTVRALAAKFPRALIAPDGGARTALIALLKTFDQAPAFPPGASPDARIDPSAQVAPSAAVLAGAVVMAGAVVGEGCVIYPGVVIEPFAEVGAGSVLFPNVVLGHRCKVGRSCIIHGGTVIGADGFGFYDDAAGRHKIPQIGNVVIADHVEIGA
ncbi:MAG: UDP-3-O-(3-hydroxymyristoyl)glucosamine N-acyltransferase, partial [Elusimicrobia bacterium]|nr:UDP-3-O-(3-hydroxymyristoyl)glucosamine N-acyltransferase [Elusimicrobiota bacterium]